MVKVYHLKCCPPLFNNYNQFNIKASVTYHPSIQREVDGLLAKGDIRPSTLAGFFLNVFVVNRQTGTLHPILNLKVI